MQVDKVVSIKNAIPTYKTEYKNKTQNYQTMPDNLLYTPAKIPVDYKYNANISFKSVSSHVLDDIDLIELENYKTMDEPTKEQLRELYRNFENIIDETQRNDLLSIDKNPENIRLPLQTEENMDKFIDVAKMYSKYKEHPIVCLGRSPKWFLNASWWMKDGIPDYKFVAFSGRWYWIYDGDYHDYSGLQRKDSWAPNEQEVSAYRKYLDRIQADPISLIKRTQETGKKVVITDYIDTGKGFTSFLEVMGNYAKDLGVLDEFGHSLKLVTIGNNEYRHNRKKLKDISDPRVWMPELLQPYDVATTAWGTGQIIEQDYYDVNTDVFKQLLINQNPNECRSTYYPCHAWTIYEPEKIRIGMERNFDKIRDLVSRLHSQGPIYLYKSVLSAYRNLLTFRILDGLEARKLLK